MKILDVREYPEFAAGAAEQAINTPLSSFEEHIAGLPREEAYLVMCKTGKRAKQAVARMRTLGFREVLALVPPEAGAASCRTATMSLERQVRIAAGAMVAVFTTLGLLVHPYFFGLSVFVGCGLVFAGVTDTCGMGLLLARMPWNQPGWGQKRTT
jgi:rhodanese-related sulfurtransferase